LVAAVLFAVVTTDDFTSRMLHRPVFENSVAYRGSLFSLYLINWNAVLYV
jgi:hypothetical protein